MSLALAGTRSLTTDSTGGRDTCGTWWPFVQEGLGYSWFTSDSEAEKLHAAAVRELEAMRSLEKFQAMQQFSISACPETLLEPDRFKGQFM